MHIKVIPARISLYVENYDLNQALLTSDLNRDLNRDLNQFDLNQIHPVHEYIKQPRDQTLIPCSIFTKHFIYSHTCFIKLFF